ncbi:hypothetical protein, conserved [Cyanidioschyzon merolae strain 10D]|uniref:UBR-type domain-containing protein n=1 Tax=Cyanidioschyzon merolae (strain NIES-3377 / 10D) TaxID=280699 RepID=M1VCY5_CYAM1|nr:hypothetical protein, conserved [Cyanidioschyzon merolae strain 10D]BAM80532.1 hypothetical protein, conserved [Cyanidioschyzon merolae strain 10D]|eukprot:XP_005536568.1 hypothetical protein, conserved [Cyanidioschyzon merolae strain 10D]
MLNGSAGISYSGRRNLRSNVPLDAGLLLLLLVHKVPNMDQVAACFRAAYADAVGSTPLLASAEERAVFVKNSLEFALKVEAQSRDVTAAGAEQQRTEIDRARQRLWFFCVGAAELLKEPGAQFPSPSLVTAAQQALRQRQQHWCNRLAAASRLSADTTLSTADEVDSLIALVRIGLTVLGLFVCLSILGEREHWRGPFLCELWQQGRAVYEALERQKASSAALRTTASFLQSYWLDALCTATWWIADLSNHAAATAWTLDTSPSSLLQIRDSASAQCSVWNPLHCSFTQPCATIRDQHWNCRGCSALQASSWTPHQCTFLLTGRSFRDQHWYRCSTCAFREDEGVCTSCALICHAGHEVSYVRFSGFFCDCGANAAATTPRTKCLLCTLVRSEETSSTTSSSEALHTSTETPRGAERRPAKAPELRDEHLLWMRPPSVSPLVELDSTKACFYHVFMEIAQLHGSSDRCPVRDASGSGETAPAGVLLAKAITEHLQSTFEWLRDSVLFRFLQSPTPGEIPLETNAQSQSVVQMPGTEQAPRKAFLPALHRAAAAGDESPRTATCNARDVREIQQDTCQVRGAGTYIQRATWKPEAVQVLTRVRHVDTNQGQSTLGMGVFWQLLPCGKQEARNPRELHWHHEPVLAFVDGLFLVTLAASEHHVAFLSDEADIRRSSASVPVHPSSEPLERAPLAGCACTGTVRSTRPTALDARRWIRRPLGFCAGELGFAPSCPRRGSLQRLLALNRETSTLRLYCVGSTVADVDGSLHAQSCASESPSRPVAAAAHPVVEPDKVRSVTLPTSGQSFTASWGTTDAAAAGDGTTVVHSAEALVGASGSRPAPAGPSANTATLVNAVGVSADAVVSDQLAEYPSNTRSRMQAPARRSTIRAHRAQRVLQRWREYHQVHAKRCLRLLLRPVPGPGAASAEGGTAYGAAEVATVPKTTPATLSLEQPERSSTGTMTFAAPAEASQFGARRATSTDTTSSQHPGRLYLLLERQCLETGEPIQEASWLDAYAIDWLLCLGRSRSSLEVLSIEYACWCWFCRWIREAHGEAAASAADTTSRPAGPDGTETCLTVSEAPSGTVSNDEEPFLWLSFADMDEALAARQPCTLRPAPCTEAAAENARLLLEQTTGSESQILRWLPDAAPEHDPWHMRERKRFRLMFSNARDGVAEGFVASSATTARDIWHSEVTEATLAGPVTAWTYGRVFFDASDRNRSPPGRLLLFLVLSNQHLVVYEYVAEARAASSVDIETSGLRQVASLELPLFDTTPCMHTLANAPEEKPSSPSATSTSTPARVLGLFYEAAQQELMLYWSNGHWSRWKLTWCREPGLDAAPEPDIGSRSIRNGHRSLSSERLLPFMPQLELTSVNSGCLFEGKAIVAEREALEDVQRVPVRCPHGCCCTSSSCSLMLLRSARTLYLLWWQREKRCWMATRQGAPYSSVSDVRVRQAGANSGAETAAQNTSMATQADSREQLAILCSLDAGTQDALLPERARRMDRPIPERCRQQRLIQATGWAQLEATACESASAFLIDVIMLLEDGTVLGTQTRLSCDVQISWNALEGSERPDRQPVSAVDSWKQQKHPEGVRYSCSGDVRLSQPHERDLSTAAARFAHLYWNHSTAEAVWLPASPEDGVAAADDEDEATPPDVASLPETPVEDHRGVRGNPVLQVRYPWIHCATSVAYQMTCSRSVSPWLGRPQGNSVPSALLLADQRNSNGGLVGFFELLDRVPSGMLAWTGDMWQLGLRSMTETQSWLEQWPSDSMELLSAPIRAFTYRSSAEQRPFRREDDAPGTRLTVLAYRVHSTSSSGAAREKRTAGLLQMPQRCEDTPLPLAADALLGQEQGQHHQLVFHVSNVGDNDASWALLGIRMAWLQPNRSGVQGVATPTQLEPQLVELLVQGDHEPATVPERGTSAPWTSRLSLELLPDPWVNPVPPEQGTWRWMEYCWDDPVVLRRNPCNRQVVLTIRAPAMDAAEASAWLVLGTIEVYGVRLCDSRWPNLLGFLEWRRKLLRQLDSAGNTRPRAEARKGEVSALQSQATTRPGTALSSTCPRLADKDEIGKALHAQDRLAPALSVSGTAVSSGIPVGNALPAADDGIATTVEQRSERSRMEINASSAEVASSSAAVSSGTPLLPAQHIALCERDKLRSTEAAHSAAVQDIASADNIEDTAAGRIVWRACWMLAAILAITGDNATTGLQLVDGSLQHRLKSFPGASDAAEDANSPQMKHPSGYLDRHWFGTWRALWKLLSTRKYCWQKRLMFAQSLQETGDEHAALEQLLHAETHQARRFLRLDDTENTLLLQQQARKCFGCWSADQDQVPAAWTRDLVCWTVDSLDTCSDQHQGREALLWAIQGLEWLYEACASWTTTTTTTTATTAAHSTTRSDQGHPLSIDAASVCSSQETLVLSIDLARVYAETAAAWLSAFDTEGAGSASAPNEEDESSQRDRPTFTERNLWTGFLVAAKRLGDAWCSSSRCWQQRPSRHANEGSSSELDFSAVFSWLFEPFITEAAPNVLTRFLQVWLTDVDKLIGVDATHPSAFDYLDTWLRACSHHCALHSSEQTECRARMQAAPSALHGRCALPWRRLPPERLRLILRASLLCVSDQNHWWSLLRLINNVVTSASHMDEALRTAEHFAALLSDEEAVVESSTRAMDSWSTLEVFWIVSNTVAPHMMDSMSLFETATGPGATFEALAAGRQRECSQRRETHHDIALSVWIRCFQQQWVPDHWSDCTAWLRAYFFLVLAASCLWFTVGNGNDLSGSADATTTCIAAAAAAAATSSTCSRDTTTARMRTSTVVDDGDDDATTVSPASTFTATDPATARMRPCEAGVASACSPDSLVEASNSGNEPGWNVAATRTLIESVELALWDWYGAGLCFGYLEQPPAALTDLVEVLIPSRDVVSAAFQLVAVRQTLAALSTVDNGASALCDACCDPAGQTQRKTSTYWNRWQRQQRVQQAVLWISAVRERELCTDLGLATLLPTLVTALKHDDRYSAGLLLQSLLTLGSELAHWQQISLSLRLTWAWQLLRLLLVEPELRHWAQDALVIVLERLLCDLMDAPDPGAWAATGQQSPACAGVCDASEASMLLVLLRKYVALYRPRALCKALPTLADWVTLLAAHLHITAELVGLERFLMQATFPGSTTAVTERSCGREAGATPSNNQEQVSWPLSWLLASPVCVDCFHEAQGAGLTLQAAGVHGARSSASLQTAQLSGSTCLGGASSAAAVAGTFVKRQPLSTLATCVRFDDDRIQATWTSPKRLHCLGVRLRHTRRSLATILGFRVLVRSLGTALDAAEVPGASATRAPANWRCLCELVYRQDGALLGVLCFLDEWPEPLLGADNALATGLALGLTRQTGRCCVPETQICPRCARLVSERGGVCPACRENVYQCRACRFIDYGRLDALLCRECGNSRLMRCDIQVETSDVDQEGTLLEALMHWRFRHTTGTSSSSISNTGSGGGTETAPGGNASAPAVSAETHEPKAAAAAAAAAWIGARERRTALVAWCLHAPTEALLPVACARCAQRRLPRLWTMFAEAVGRAESASTDQWSQVFEPLHRALLVLFSSGGFIDGERATQQLPVTLGSLPQPARDAWLRILEEALVASESGPRNEHGEDARSRCEFQCDLGQAYLHLLTQSFACSGAFGADRLLQGAEATSATTMLGGMQQRIVIPATLFNSTADYLAAVYSQRWCVRLFQRRWCRGQSPWRRPCPEQSCSEACIWRALFHPYAPGVRTWALRVLAQRPGYWRWLFHHRILLFGCWQALRHGCVDMLDAYWALWSWLWHHERAWVDFWDSTGGLELLCTVIAFAAGGVPSGADSKTAIACGCRRNAWVPSLAEAVIHACLERIQEAVVLRGRLQWTRAALDCLLCAFEALYVVADTRMSLAAQLALLIQRQAEREPLLAHWQARWMTQRLERLTMSAGTVSCLHTGATVLERNEGNAYDR